MKTTKQKAAEIKENYSAIPEKQVSAGIYVLTEWDGKGSGEKTVYQEKSKAMSNRECTLTYESAVKKYGKSHFMGMDVKCTTIDSYTSEKAMREGNVKTSKNWY